MIPDLGRFRPPDPPPGLREHVLAVAHSPSGLPADSWIDRIWENRTLRRGWLVTVALLALFRISSGPVPGATDRPKWDTVPTQERIAPSGELEVLLSRLERPVVGAGRGLLATGRREEANWPRRLEDLER